MTIAAIVGTHTLTLNLVASFDPEKKLTIGTFEVDVPMVARSQPGTDAVRVELAPVGSVIAAALRSAADELDSQTTPGGLET